MRELMSFLPVLIFFVVIVSVVRTAAKVARRVNEQLPPTPRTPADFDPEQVQRTRRIQEEIRRKIAERRGTTATPEVQPVGPRMEPPVIFEETREAPEPAVTAATHAVLERQQQLADQMRALQQARVLEQRRATQLSVGVQKAAATQTGLLKEARGNLLADLRDPSSLRRAFVLREVLGPPVGLR